MSTAGHNKHMHANKSMDIASYSTR